MNKTDTNSLRYILIFSVILVLGALLYVLRSVLLPFVVGIAIAYFLDPSVNKLTGKMKISRGVATSLVLGAFLLILVPILILLGGMAFSQIADFLSNLPVYMEKVVAKIKEVLVAVGGYLPAGVIDNTQSMWQGNIGDSVRPIAKIVKTIATNGFAFINVLSLLLISPVVAFYMLRDWHDFTGNIFDMVPKKYKKDVKQGIAAVNRIISGYLRGQVLVCLALGAFYSVGLWLVGLNMGVLIGLIAGVISFIPYVGSVSGFLMAMILVITQYGTWPKIAEVIAVFLIGQFIEGNFLTPKLVGENIGLHPVWVMFALLAGGVLLGLLGMIIAVPLAACIGVFCRFLLEKYKKSAIYLEK